MNYTPLYKGKQYVPGIYMIKSKCGKTYIGSAVILRGRFMCHRCSLEKNKHDNQRLQNYFNKYGNDSLEFIVIEHCEKDKLLEREQYFIDLHNPFFNICRVAGATYGLKPWLGKKHSEETKAKIKAGITETFKNRVRVVKPIKRSREEAFRDVIEFNRTKEGRQIMSERQKGNTHWLGKKHKPETIANRMGAGNGRARKVFCIELNREFSYCKEASDFLGVGKSSITNSIIREHKVLGKYTFRYAS